MISPALMNSPGERKLSSGLLGSRIRIMLPVMQRKTLKMSGERTLARQGRLMTKIIFARRQTLQR